MTLEQERQASSRLSEQAEQERLSLHRRLQQLQVQLETEQAKALEMSTALGRERELRTGVSEEDKTSQEVDGSLLEKLQRELDDKHAQVCLCAFKKVYFNTNRPPGKVTMSVPDGSAPGGAASQSAGGPAARGGSERRRAEPGPSEATARAGGSADGPGSVGNTGNANIGEPGAAGERAGEKQEPGRREGAAGGEVVLVERAEWSEGGERTFGHRGSDANASLILKTVLLFKKDTVSLGGSSERTKDWVFQQKSGNVQSPSASPAACGPWRTVDKILSKLYLISSKVSGMASKPGSR